MSVISSEYIIGADKTTFMRIYGLYLTHYQKATIDMLFDYPNITDSKRMDAFFQLQRWISQSCYGCDLLLHFMEGKGSKTYFGILLSYTRLRTEFVTYLVNHSFLISDTRFGTYQFQDTATMEDTQKYIKDYISAHFSEHPDVEECPYYSLPDVRFACMYVKTMEEQDMEEINDLIHIGDEDYGEEIFLPVGDTVIDVFDAVSSYYDGKQARVVVDTFPGYDIQGIDLIPYIGGIPTSLAIETVTVLPDGISSAVTCKTDVPLGDYGICVKYENTIPKLAPVVLSCGADKDRSFSDKDMPGPEDSLEWLNNEIDNKHICIVDTRASPQFKQIEAIYEWMSSLNTMYYAGQPENLKKLNPDIRPVTELSFKEKDVLTVRCCDTATLVDVIVALRDVDLALFVTECDMPDVPEYINVSYMDDLQIFKEKGGWMCLTDKVREMHIEEYAELLLHAAPAMTRREQEAFLCGLGIFDVYRKLKIDKDYYYFDGKYYQFWKHPLFVGLADEEKLQLLVIKGHMIEKETLLQMDPVWGGLLAKLDERAMIINYSGKVYVREPGDWGNRVSILVSLASMINNLGWAEPVGGVGLVPF